MRFVFVLAMPADAGASSLWLPAALPSRFQSFAQWPAVARSLPDCAHKARGARGMGDFAFSARGFDSRHRSHASLSTRDTYSAAADRSPARRG